MRNIMENQLSWLALFMTAFYSLLASCRGEDCGHEELQRCARPLQQIANTPTNYDVKSKAALEELCPELEAGMKCIHRYTQRCMTDSQREHFIELYSGTNKAVMELCQDGLYQDKFLMYSPCMQKVKQEFDTCSQNYASTIMIAKQPNQVKSICCSFQEYLTCSHNTVLKACGNEAAKFAREFLDRMSSSLIKMHCQVYSADKCTSNHSADGGNAHGNSFVSVDHSKAGSTATVAATSSFILPLILFMASRYLF